MAVHFQSSAKWLRSDLVLQILQVVGFYAIALTGAHCGFETYCNEKCVLAMIIFA